MFKVSVKGIIKKNGKCLLRKNERSEYELLGGKLEYTDDSLYDRVIQEFKEESGINIKANKIKEPWFYIIGNKANLIIPIDCDILFMPHTLYDQDGGILEWINMENVKTLDMPSGYKDSIIGHIPSLSFTHTVSNKTFQDHMFRIFVDVETRNGLISNELNDSLEMRVYLMNLGIKSVIFKTVDYFNHDIHIIYEEISL